VITPSLERAVTALGRFSDPESNQPDAAGQYQADHERRTGKSFHGVDTGLNRPDFYPRIAANLEPLAVRKSDDAEKDESDTYLY
jgi:hypothetical protein